MKFSKYVKKSAAVLGAMVCLFQVGDVQASSFNSMSGNRPQIGTGISSLFSQVSTPTVSKYIYFTGLEDKTIGIGDVRDFDFFEGVTIVSNIQNLDRWKVGTFRLPGLNQTRKNVFQYHAKDPITKFEVAELRTIYVTNYAPVITIEKELVWPYFMNNLDEYITVTDVEDGNLINNVQFWYESRNNVTKVRFAITDSDGNYTSVLSEYIVK